MTRASKPSFDESFVSLCGKYRIDEDRTILSTWGRRRLFVDVKKALPVTLHVLAAALKESEAVEWTELGITAEGGSSIKYKKARVDIAAIRKLISALPYHMASSSLTTMRVNGIELNAASIESLAKGLHKNRSLRTLSLAGSSMGSRNFAALAHSLELVDSLTSLDVSRCSISDSAAESLALLLRKCKDAQVDLRFHDSLRLSAPVDPLDSNLLASRYRLQHVIASDNNFTDEACQTFARALHYDTTLLTLDLSRNNIDFKGITYFSRLVAWNTTLQRVDLSYNPGIHSFLAATNAGPLGHYQVIAPQSANAGSELLDGGRGANPAEFTGFAMAPLQSSSDEQGTRGAARHHYAGRAGSQRPRSSGARASRRNGAQANRSGSKHAKRAPASGAGAASTSSSSLFSQLSAPPHPLAAYFTCLFSGECSFTRQPAPTTPADHAAHPGDQRTQGGGPRRSHASSSAAQNGAPHVALVSKTDADGMLTEDQFTTLRSLLFADGKPDAFTLQTLDELLEGDRAVREQHGMAFPGISGLAPVVEKLKRRYRPSDVLTFTDLVLAASGQPITPSSSPPPQHVHRAPQSASSSATDADHHHHLLEFKALAEKVQHLPPSLQHELMHVLRQQTSNSKSPSGTPVVERYVEENQSSSSSCREVMCYANAPVPYPYPYMHDAYYYRPVAHHHHHHHHSHHHHHQHHHQHQHHHHSHQHHAHHAPHMDSSHPMYAFWAPMPHPNGHFSMPPQTPQQRSHQEREHNAQLDHLNRTEDVMRASDGSLPEATDSSAMNAHDRAPPECSSAITPPSMPVPLRNQESPATPPAQANGSVNGAPAPAAAAPDSLSHQFAAKSSNPRLAVLDDDCDNSESTSDSDHELLHQGLLA
eukprot:gene19462-29992_t